jgi:uncharacterized protein YkwD
VVNRLVLPVFLFSIFLGLIPTNPARAEARYQPSYQSTVFDLVNAVNALRAADGLPAYGINSILMFTAQNQADFMASTGNVTHTGPGGSSLTSRLLAAGYPLAGDLSLGGFRAENITSGGENSSAQSAVNGWMGDALHQNTMLSPNLSEIGAGIAVANGRSYYVIDCAQPTTGGSPPVSTSVVGSGTTGAVNEAPIYPVARNTANPNGDVIHEVKPGQTLWQIAISYEVKIDDIKRLNNLIGNDIYPGESLLIKKEAAPTTAPPTETIMSTVTLTVTPFETAVPTSVLTTTPAAIAVKQNNSTVMASVIAIVALAILGAGYFTWLGKSSEDRSG